MGRSVFIPLTVSLLLHLAIAALLLFHIGFAQELPPPPVLNIVQAKLVQLEAIPAAAKPPPAPKQAEPAAPPPEPPPPEPPKPEPVKPEPPAPPPPPKPDLAKQKQVQLEKEKAEKAKQAEQQKKEAERKRKEQEAQRKKQQQEEQLRKQREQADKAELAKAMEAEEAELSAGSAQEAVASYIGLIARAVQDNWSRPPSARRDMQVTLLIQLIPTGDVVNVSVLESSGNGAFDQSAENAVRKAARFPELQGLKPAEFEKNFRRLKLVFRPEDLRQ